MLQKSARPAVVGAGGSEEVQEPLLVLSWGCDGLSLSVQAGMGSFAPSLEGQVLSKQQRTLS